jgi:hypothetical protein
MLLKYLEKIDNFEKLSKEVLELIEKVNPIDNQIVCQTINQNDSDWFCGAGRIDELEESDETKYIHINPALEGSEIAKNILKFKGFRSRIMILPSRKCYSIHADPSPRIHIPIITNTQCWILWPEKSVCKRLLPGVAYWTDTRVNHSFINGSTQNRIHLIMNVHE